MASQQHSHHCRLLIRSCLCNVPGLQCHSCLALRWGFPLYSTTISFAPCAWKALFISFMPVLDLLIDLKMQLCYEHRLGVGHTSGPKIITYKSPLWSVEAYWMCQSQRLGSMTVVGPDLYAFWIPNENLPFVPITVSIITELKQCYSTT